MIKKLVLVATAALGCVFMLSSSASAHVLIIDESKSIGAVLHVVPDDDPIAGQQANLFFDIQTQKINKDTAKLVITNATTGEINRVPIIIDASSVTADYTFPTQGVYNLTLTVSSDKTYTFSHSQRISRGVTNSALDKPTYPLASIALVFCAITFLLLLVILFNHRKEIWRKSTL